MIERDDDNASRPLPRDWLPEATPPEGAPEWQVRLERIITAAEPRLGRPGKRGSESEMPWSIKLGSWWKSAAALAAASAGLLFMFNPSQSSGNSALPLSVVAAEGEPFALWEGLGIDAHPVLALIAVQERTQ